jgi:hypothetical protein
MSPLQTKFEFKAQYGELLVQQKVVMMVSNLIFLETKASLSSSI